jgi:peptide/nickel transport system permease protein
MREHSPSDARLLEPVDVGTELRTTSDEALATELLVARGEEQPPGLITRGLGVVFWLSVGWMALVVVLAVLAPMLTSAGILPDPNKIGRPLNAFPTAGHLLGTDGLGRDLLSRLIWGARVSLPVGFASIALGLLIGGTIGVLSGYLKGWSDSVLMTVMDIILAFPALLLAFTLVSFLDAHDIPHIALAIGIISVPQIARLVRANTITFREREFVMAARTLGASHGRIIRREILPNVLPPVLSFAVIGVAVAIAAESYLAFIGVSVPLPAATWGKMVQEAKDGLTQGHAYQVFLPSGVLVITILSLYFIGDRLGQLFNVRESAL